MPAISNKGVPGYHMGIYATLASLPAASAANKGLTAFVSNARKAAEGAAAGTGNLVFSDGTAWRRVDTGATADA
jgi:hypothetical protein